MTNGISSVTIAWARHQLLKEIRGFANNPEGYPGPCITPAEAWQRFENLAGDLAVDAVAILLEGRTPYEIARFEDLTKQEFG